MLVTKVGFDEIDGRMIFEAGDDARGFFVTLNERQAKVAALLHALRLEVPLGFEVAELKTVLDL